MLKPLKVISLVPSWTETLIECGVEVVGRTRYCIHPASRVGNIPAVGGTKGVDWPKAASLNADLVIFDREENTKEMAESCPLPYIDTHITSVKDLPPTLRRMGKELRNHQLPALACRWDNLPPPLSTPAIHDLPGVIEWLKPIEEKVERIVYVIWKNPWMIASHQTFIGSVFEKLGHGHAFFNHQEKYPTVDLSELTSDNTLLLFSSEPFPFHKKRKDLLPLHGPKAIVDGECFSWFGLRTLKFLESIR